MKNEKSDFYTNVVIFINCHVFFVISYACELLCVRDCRGSAAVDRKGLLEKVFLNCIYFFEIAASSVAMTYRIAPEDDGAVAKPRKARPEGATRLRGTPNFFTIFSILTKNQFSTIIFVCLIQFLALLQGNFRSNFL